MGDIDEAMEDLNQALKLEPANAEVVALRQAYADTTTFLLIEFDPHCSWLAVF